MDIGELFGYFFILFLIVSSILYGIFPCRILGDRVRNKRLYSKRKKHFSDHIRYDSEAVILAKKIINKLANDKLLDYLLRDYSTNIYLTHNDLLSSQKRLSSKCHDVVNDVLSFLELPTSVSVNIAYKKLDQTVFSAGSYNHYGVWNQISITADPSLDPWNLAAIICHESTHYFINYHNLEDAQIDAEKQTDVLAVLLGFGKIMEKGYQPCVDSSKRWGYTLVHKRTFGYISHKECVQIYKYLHEIRPDIKSWMNETGKAKRIVECPYCKQRCKVPISVKNLEVKCNKCGSSYLVRSTVSVR